MNIVRETNICLAPKEQVSIKLDINLSGKRITIGRTSGERVHTAKQYATKGVKLSGKRTENNRITPIFLSFFIGKRQYILVGNVSVSCVS